MSPRGGWRGGGRPAKAPEEARQTLNCRIKPSTMEWIKKEKEFWNKSTGEYIDFMVECFQPEEKPLKKPKKLPPPASAEETLERLHEVLQDTYNKRQKEQLEESDT